jgi:hypothetical protein
MISLEKFTDIVSSLLRYNNKRDRLYTEFKLDLDPIDDDLCIAVDLAISEIIPEKNLEYFYDTIYSEGFSNDQIEELYFNVFK